MTALAIGAAGVVVGFVALGALAALLVWLDRSDEGLLDVVSVRASAEADWYEWEEQVGFGL